MRNWLKILCAIVALMVASIAGAATDSVPKPLTVSLITCYPGPDVYALCGHTAIRIRSEKMDSVWNYGMFDFSQDDFIYRFVKGETDYMLGAYPFEWFMPEYVRRGSKVVEQELNLSQPEARRLLEMLRREALPKNCIYRYNYVKDNCAPRPMERIDSAASSLILLPETVKYGTFRRAMRHYHANYPWYQFGIDLVLGSGLDYELSPREEMFVPVEMMERLDKARYDDGRPVVSRTNVLYEGRGQAVYPPTPWYLTPLFWGWIVFAGAVVCAIVDIRRRRPTKIVYSLYWALTGVAGLIVWFLVLYSSHEATSPNILRWWLNPLMLIAAVTVWWHRARYVTDVFAIYQAICSLILLIIWPLQPQSGNPAVFPLLGAAAVLCASYAIICVLGSYNIEATTAIPPARKRKAPPQKRRKA